MFDENKRMVYDSSIFECSETAEKAEKQRETEVARKNKIDTRLEIIQVATTLFLEKGYTNVTVSELSKKVGISKGNLTFYFSTKEHVLAELIKMLVDFQWQMLRKEIISGRTLLIASLFEITAMAESCYDDPIARDLYVSAYRSSLSLRIIRESDTKKAIEIFTEFCPEWERTDFVLAENIVSGIEYAIFTTEREQQIPLDKKIEGSLDVILKIYNVPEEVRRETIQMVFGMDYRNVGHRMLAGFRQYVEEVNRRALAAALENK